MSFSSSNTAIVRKYGSDQAALGERRRREGNRCVGVR
jgi:hypothetical protein